MKLVREAFDKYKFGKTINAEFTQLSSAPVEEVPDTTVDEFFGLYEELFLQIPKTGTINSHEFLIRESSDYVGAEINNSEIQALLDEIFQLREENLELRREQSNLIQTITSQQSTAQTS